MRVDVAINYYGKPWQTLLTVESLLEQSGAHIDRIYLIKERRQPRADESIAELVSRHSGRLVVFTPSHYLGFGRPPRRARLRRNAALRRSVRYQYALEQTDKRYLFVTHNDVFYKRDLVGELLRVMQEGGHAGAGLIGQCWNCPAHTAGLCDHGRYGQLKLSRVQALSLLVRVPSPPGRPRFVDLRHPLPLPECRLNEFACLIDAGLYRRESLPRGSSPPFGYNTVDTGCMWFHTMVLKGYTFANVPINEYMDHDAGHPDLFDPGRYEGKERAARELLCERYGLDAE